MKYSTILTIYLTLLFGEIGHSQISFKKVIPNFECSQVIQTNDKGYVVTGASDQVTFLKFDSQGNPLWANLISGYFSLDVIETDDNYLLICGTQNVNGDDKGIVIKSNNNGEIAWAKSYDMPFAIQPSNGSCEIIKTSDGNFLIFWVVQNGWEESYIFLVKINPDGDVLWAKRYDDYKGVRGHIAPSSDGGFLFCAAHSHLDTFPDGSMVTKINFNGDLSWSKIIDNMSSATGVIEMSDGGCIVVGDKIIRLNSSGDIIWSKDFPEYARGVFKTADNKIMIIANLGWGLGGSIKKVDEDGDLLFSNNLQDVPLPLFNGGNTQDGGAVFCGYKPNPIPVPSDGYVLKINCNGFAGDCTQPYDSVALANATVNQHNKLLTITNVNVQVIPITTWSNAIYTDNTLCYCANAIAAFTYQVDSLTVSFYNNSSCAESFFWTFGDGDTSYTQNAVHTYDGPGDFQVCLEVYDGCTYSDSVCQTIHISTTKTTEAPVEFEMQAYPNPFTQEINFKCGNIKIRVLTILDTRGKQILNLPQSENIIKWNGKNSHGLDVEPGVYIARITTSDSSIFFKKIIKMY